MRRLGFLVSILLSLALLQSCQSNPCASDSAIEKAKENLALKILAQNKPQKFLETFFSSAISFLTGEGKMDETLRKEIEPILKEIKLRDVSKPTKKSEREYACKALFEYRGSKNLVEYTLEEIQVGKEKLYKVEVIDINKVE
ncbi:MAG: hypothetical protein ACK4LT_01965 [Aquificaceae bacterium]